MEIETRGIYWIAQNYQHRTRSGASGALHSQAGSLGTTETRERSDEAFELGVELRTVARDCVLNLGVNWHLFIVLE
jgi:hypothetical protein